MIGIIKINDKLKDNAFCNIISTLSESITYNICKKNWLKETVLLCLEGLTAAKLTALFRRNRTELLNWN